MAKARRGNPTLRMIHWQMDALGSGEMWPRNQKQKHDLVLNGYKVTDHGTDRPAFAGGCGGRTRDHHGHRGRWPKMNLKAKLEAGGSDIEVPCQRGADHQWYQQVR